MKKITVLCLAVMMVFTMLCPVMADGELPELARISLSENKSYYSSAVPSGTVLKINGYDAEGNERALSDVTFTYTSTRPWVLDVDDNGTIVDGGYDGTTIVTAKASNGVSASLIFVKSPDNGYNQIGIFDEKGLRDYGSDKTGYREQSPDFTGSGNPNIITDGGHDGGKYYPGVDGAYGLYVKRGSWDYAGKLRVAQGWFYDDGTSKISINTSACQFDQTTEQGTSWHNYDNWQLEMPGFDQPQFAFDFGGVEALYFNGTAARLQADAGATVYTGTEIERTVGWHQYTMILGDDGNGTVYLDGVATPIKPSLIKRDSRSSLDVGLTIASEVATMPMDDVLLSSNLNTEKPAGFSLPAKSISLSKNTSYYSTTVPEGTKLIVTGLDKYGEEADISDLTFTYESTRPWVLDVDENGNIIDGGYEGTTIVTAKAGDFEASLIFIKAAYDGINNTLLVTDADTKKGNMDHSFSDAVTNTNYIYHRIYNGDQTSALSVSGGHDDDGDANTDKGICADITTPGTNADWSVNLKYTNLSWDVEGGIRIAQMWFLDDLKGEVSFAFGASASLEKGVGLTKGAVASIQEALGDTNHTYGYYHFGTISAAADATEYSYKVSDTTPTYSAPVKRTKGWHQATMVVNENGTVDTYIDGVLFQTAKLVTHNYHGHQIYAQGKAADKFDDIVIARNLNTTKPTVNIAVSYDETQGSVLCNNNKVANGGKAEAYYDDSVNFTFEPKAGFKLDSVIYDGINVTDFIKNGVLSVDCKNAELVVTFKEIPVEAPSVSKTMEIKTDQKVDGNPSALMYMQIQPGYGYTVTESGIVLSDKENDAQNGMKLVAKNTDNTNVTSGLFGIRVYGSALNGINCYFNPFVKYQNGEEIKTVYGDQDSFTLNQ